MRRLYRLLAPGILFASVGLSVLVVSEWPWFQMRGGLATTGGVALALQLVLSAVALSAIDDLAGGSPPFVGRRAGRGGKLIDISTRPVGFSQAFVDMHRRTFWPALLLAFGAGATLSALVAGLTQDFYAVALLRKFGTNRTEVALGAVLLLGAILLWWRGGRSYFGWVIGFAVAAVAGQFMFVPTTIEQQTVEGWAALAITLCLLRLGALVATKRRAAQRKQKEVDSGAQARQATEHAPTGGK